MPENILVVEYEPRYTDRVKHALAGQPVSVAFAKDGEEAIRAIEAQVPSLIVMTAVVPKVSATELIKTIRARAGMQKTPILLTVSGYSGKNPVMDAQKIGASDILPKPYTESDLIGRVQQMLGISLSAPAVAGGPTVVPPSAAEVTPAAKKKSDDLDKILADTLSGARVPKKPGPPTSPGTTPKPPEPKPRTSSDLDKLLNDTLSGLEKTVKKVAASPGGAAEAAAPAPPPVAALPSSPVAAPRPAAPAPAPPVPPPAQAPAPAVSPAPAGFVSEKLPILDSIPMSQPVFPAVEPVREEEEEPTDGTKFGQYVLLDRIATGGMAEVWKARMRGVEGFQKTVAIKKILPHLSDNQDFIEMFIDEAKLAAQLSHNNIIHIYDLGKIQSSYYIAMEYVDGSDLKTILRKAQDNDQPMSVELAAFIASKVASALDYAHRKRDFQDQELGLVHRDVSPQNVLISEEGDIKLCDFGIAKAASKASHTQAGALKGKLQYMSPEQAWGRTIDRRSDIFALATVLYEMLTGRKLFGGDNELSILDQVREARVSAPSDVNDEVTPEIDRIMAKALAKEPADRYQTAGELARDLDAVLYSFRPTPTSADLAIYMHRLAAPVAVMQQHERQPEPEPAAEPKVLVPLPMPVPAPAAPVAAPAVSHMPSWEAPRPSETAATTAPAMFGTDEPQKKSPVAAIAIAAVVVLALVGGFFFMRRGGDAAPATAATGSQVAVASTSAVPAPVPVPAATDTASTIALTSSAVVPTATSLDSRLVDQEVQKRLAAERARMEQSRQTEAAAPATPAPVRNVPAPAPTTAAPTPDPVQERPAPVVQQPAPQVAAETPRPTPAPAEPARVREGDLVATGTEGLVQPRITKRASVPYPPLAKVQKVQGTVICSVLVSEAGNVLDVRVLRGSNRGVGLNEAAEQMMRRSAFAPGTKDGVRVKAWTTVPVDFKL